LDTESIQEAFEKVTSVFQSEENQGETEKSSGGSILVMIFSTIFYFVLILYQMDYFEGVRKTYFSNRLNSTVSQILDDFDQSFWRYMKLRTRIVLLLAILYLITFMIMDMPGMILITIVIIVLSYIPYLQYLALIPVAIGCLVLSIEYSQSFLLLFGIVVGVFILASILEELLLIPWIMERNIGMNPVIMILAASIGSYLFGMVGALIGVPLASLAIIYVKRYFLPSYQVVLQEEEEKP
jgi:predicted PurR-regulated permease PerM